MARRRAIRVIAGIAASFAGLAGVIIILLGMDVIGLVMAKLMLVALLGMYVGFGVLFAVYRLMGKLD